MSEGDSGESKQTTDHETIKNWAEERDGHPATVRDTMEGNEPGVLRFDFEEAESDDDLEEIDWEVFFEKFEENNLAMLYQETVESGEESRFFKFVNRN